MTSPRPSRNPWPFALIGVFGFFILATAGLVTLAVSQRMDLVTPDYYAQEMTHQAQMDRVVRARGLPAPVTVTYDASRQAIQVTLPAAHGRLESTGRIQLYRPSAAGEDRRIVLRVDDAGRQTVDAQGLSAGLWRVRITWAVAAQEYFHEQPLVIPGRTS